MHVHDGAVIVLDVPLGTMSHVDYGEEQGRGSQKKSWNVGTAMRCITFSQPPVASACLLQLDSLAMPSSFDIGMAASSSSLTGWLASESFLGRPPAPKRLLPLDLVLAEEDVDGSSCLCCCCRSSSPASSVGAGASDAHHLSSTALDSRFIRVGRVLEADVDATGSSWLGRQV